jgi:6-phosphogluconolactonase (cycloisomerase 2 family)
MTSITVISGTDFSTYDGGNYQAMRGIASSTDGAIIYISMNGVPNIGVVKSIDNGTTWNIVYPYQVGFTSIACSSDGNIVYAANLGDGLYKSIDAGSTWNKVSFLPNNSLPGGSSNPEITDSHFGGYDLTNIYQVACDSTGTKLIMTTNAAASIYQSTDSGVTWSFIYAIPGYSTNPQSPTYIASNTNGTILYAALNNTSTKNIIVSKNSGATWTSINMLGVSGPFATLSTNTYGDFIFCVDGNSSLNIFYPTHIDKALLVPSAGNTLVALANYNSGNNVIISQNNYLTITNGAVVLYSIVNKYTPGDVPCFKEDTKILCFIDNKEIYVKIQDIKKGDLVKTFKNGYLPVNIIGKKDIYHPISKERIKNQLYKCSQNEYAELFEDLIITGCHSLLVDNFINEEQKQKVIEVNEKIYITDNKYRLPACVDLRASVYENEGTYTIYHFALENENYFWNYGVYANGLLVETCSIRYLTELSNMSIT